MLRHNHEDEVKKGENMKRTTIYLHGFLNGTGAKGACTRPISCTIPQTYSDNESSNKNENNDHSNNKTI